MEYTMTIAGVEKTMPLCKITDDLYIAGFIMFNDVEITEACARDLLKLAPEFDVLLTAETKGIPLTYEMAQALHAGRCNGTGKVDHYKPRSDALPRRRRKKGA